MMENSAAMSNQEPTSDAAIAGTNQQAKREPTSLIGDVLTWYAIISLAVAGIAGGVLWPSSYLPFSEKTDALVLVFSVWGAGIAHAMFFIALARILDYLKIIANKLA